MGRRLPAIFLLIAASLASVAEAEVSHYGNSTRGLRGAHPHRQLAATITKAATAFSTYLRPPGLSIDYVQGGIGSIYRGDQASYEITVPAGGAYSVSYSLASKSAASVQLSVVKGSNCYEPRWGYVTQMSFKSGGAATYKWVTAEFPLPLDKGKQTLTVCFNTLGSASFGGVKLQSTSKHVVPKAANSYPSPGKNGCYSSLVWESTHGEVRLNGKTFRIKGASWFGFDTALFNLNGLWATTVPAVLDTLKAHDINVLRMPVSLKMALNFQTKVDGCNYLACVSSGLSWDEMSYAFDQAAARGMFVVLDMHNLTPDTNAADGLWYNSHYTEKQFIQGWLNLVGRFKSKPNFMAIDVFNEPHATASWGEGNKATDFGLAAARIIEAIDKAHPDFKGLYFVEGVYENADSIYPASQQYPQWWGGNVQALFRHPVVFSGSNAGSLGKRLVYSPHVYGPDVWLQPYFKVANFPKNMPAIWDKTLGFIKRASGGHASVIGEWGGSYTGKDKTLQDALVTYLIETCNTDAIWWSLNANSGDTGGLLLDNWKSVNTAKMALIARLQPHPTKFGAISKGHFCPVTWGAYGNSKCAAASSTL